MRAEIISIGNELLIGDTVNTNASWMGAFMTEHGFEVSRVYTISDNIIQIKQSIVSSMSESDIVLVTGGLGPTHDDMTKRAVAELYNMKMRTDNEVLAFVQDYFARRNIPFSHSNFGQAEVPEDCEVLFNNSGTAPGMWFNVDGKYLAVMPGVPHEMQYLMQNKVAPKLHQVFGHVTHIYSRYIKTAGIGESTLSDNVLGNLDSFLKDGVSLAFLPMAGGVTLRLNGTGSTKSKAEQSVVPLADFIHKNAFEFIIGEGKELTVSEVVGQLLIKSGQTLAVAESCTGGMIANEITHIAGCSAYFVGGIVAYSNSVKINELSVLADDIETHGAVSKQVALQMAKNVAIKLGTDIGVSTTGIAGPDGGSIEKPVGTTWIGYWDKNQHFAIKASFTKDRIINKERTTRTVLELVRRILKGIDSVPYNMEKQYP